MVSVDMGTVSFESDKIPVKGPSREVINEKIEINGKELEYCAATVGNPHCIILQNTISPEETRVLGPLLETHPLFPNRTNVQFMEVMDRGNIRIEIWERGAGYTLASGSSSSASAAVAFRLGLCDQDICVHMPGGEIDISITDDFFISMSGAVTKVAEGEMSPEIFK